jgi:serine/threonine-protein kinase
LVIGGGLFVATRGDDGSGPAKNGNRAERPTAKKPKRDRGASAPPARTAPSNPAPSPPAPQQTAAAAPAALNEQGYALMNKGRYDEAIPLLQRAVAAFPQDSSDLTLAYALYNLGRSLRLAGRPAEAIPYLERRLAFDNQRAVVRRELAAARAAAG